MGTLNLAPDGMSADDAIGLYRGLNAAGVQHLIFNMPNVHELSPLESFDEMVIPAVADL